jgi:hypothetical protein
VKASDGYVLSDLPNVYIALKIIHPPFIFMTKKLYDEAVSYLRGRGIQSAEVGIVLGTGLGWLTIILRSKKLLTIPIYLIFRRLP